MVAVNLSVVVAIIKLEVGDMHTKILDTSILMPQILRIDPMYGITMANTD